MLAITRLVLLFALMGLKRSCTLLWSSAEKKKRMTMVRLNQTRRLNLRGELEQRLFFSSARVDGGREERKEDNA